MSEEDTDPLLQNFSVIERPKAARQKFVTVRFLKEKKCLSVCDTTIQAQGVGSYFRKLWRNFAKTGETLATIV